MKMTADDTLFIDTSVLLHAVVAESPHHRQCRRAFAQFANEALRPVISLQIVREMFVQMTHPKTFAIPFEPIRAALIIREVLLKFDLIDGDALSTGQQKFLNLLRISPCVESKYTTPRLLQQC
jgi:predicted nucleic acid-binding protein